VAQLIPFAGWRYAASAGPLAELLAPPYDVISPEQQAELGRRNPRNAVRLELAEGGEEHYAAVAALLRDWQATGALVRDPTPMLYLYEQEFIESGRGYRRRALITAVEAQPWEEGAVRPHEHTMSGPKADRLKLLEATGMQFSPVFMIARDRAGQLRQFCDDAMAGRDPDGTATTADGDTHRLWVVEAGRYEMRRLAPLLSETFTIADGHHRYETAVEYRRRRLEREGMLPRDHPARFAMTAIVAADDPGLVVRPIHRIVPRPAPPDWRERLAASFEVRELAGHDVATLESALRASPGTMVALGFTPGQAHRLAPRDDTVFAAIAPPGHSDRFARVPAIAARYGVLDPLWGLSDADLAAGAVEYTHLAGEAVERVAEGGICGLLLRPAAIGDVIQLAEQGERMPQKSTFFHPKLGTGLVFYPLEG
jgi:uncharacterized protein (DUF1015 family)